MLGKLLLPVHTKRAIKNESPTASVGYREALKIGLIFRYLNDVHYQRIVRFSKEFVIDRKDVSILAFYPKPTVPPEPGLPAFTTKNLSFWGKLTSEEIELFLQQQYDFLINLDLEPHDFVDNILSRVQAKCKIGHYKVQREIFYQLMIQVNPADDFEQFLEQVSHYIKKVRAHA